MRSALNHPLVGLVAVCVSSLLLIAPAAAQTPHGLKTHMRLVNSMPDQTTPGEWRGGDGWSTTGPLVTRGVNNISNPLGMYSNSDFTATADYSLLHFSGFGSAQSLAPNGLFLWVDDWIGAEPRAQYRDRLYVTSATLPVGTPVVLRFELTLSGSTTIVDTNPSAWVTANFSATHAGPTPYVTLSLGATPGVTSVLFDTAVGDSIDVAARLHVTMHANGMLNSGPRSGSIAADVTAQVGAIPQTAGVTIRRSSSGQAADAPVAAARALMLEPARPNPFNPSTTLSLVLPGQSPVELALFDVRGHRVRRLYEGWLDQGRHEFRWDGRDDEGQAMPSGIYVARAVTANHGVEMQRLSLVR